MIVVIAGTNRAGSNTLKVAKLALRQLQAVGEEATLIDLAELPAQLFTPTVYGDKPAEFEPFQKAILEAVTPEYNGSYPGILKYFIDMLRFPESLVDMPAAFIGLASGEWGGLRSVEQLEMVFHYRHAHLFGRRLFLKGISKLLDDDGHLLDPELTRRFDELVSGFAGFCRKVRQG